MTTKTGTPSSMPQKPNSPLPRIMENMTQKPVMPVELPRILGPIRLPSTCCRMMMNTMKIRHLVGLTIRMISALGTAPMSGPKKGMMFVTPMMTLTSRVYGICRMEQTM